VVANVRHNGITDVVKEKFYIPHAQWHKATGFPIRGMTLVIRTGSDPSTIAGPIRQAVRSLDPSLPVADVRTMQAVVGAALSTPRFTGILLGSFAVLALVLSAIGIYGVLSYLVSRRTREIGIRVAIGAGRAEVLGLVLRSGMLLAIAGVVIGIVVALGASRVMSGMLHQVSPLDPVTFTAVGVVLTLVALFASLVPAWRAARVDPVVALKAE
jgi:putative ABC transport system permease protein